MYTPYQKFISQNPDVERCAQQREMETKVDSILKILRRRSLAPAFLELAKQALGGIQDIEVLDHLEDEALDSKDEQDIHEWLDEYLPQSNIEDKT